VILHVERVAQAGDARELCRRDAQARARQVLDDLRRGVSLPGVHARSRDQDERRGRLHHVGRLDSSLGYIHYPAIANRHAYDFDFDGAAQAVVVAEAPAYESAEVEKM
jgi:hypothetical protein